MLGVHVFSFAFAYLALAFALAFLSSFASFAAFAIYGVKVVLVRGIGFSNGCETVRLLGPWVILGTVGSPFTLVLWPLWCSLVVPSHILGMIVYFTEAS